MTATEFQNNIVLPLANSAFCRYWLCWREDSSSKIYLAIQVAKLEANGKYFIIKCPDFEERGFKEIGANKKAPIYIIERTNEDGTPYETKLF